MSYTTQQARSAYPELVVGGVTSTWTVLGSRPKCDYSKTVAVAFPAGPPDYPPGSVVWLKFHPSVVEWAKACAAIFAAHGYRFGETAGGSVSCRKITNGIKTSPHAHGIAFDINPSKNRYRSSSGLIQWGRQTDMPKALIADLEAVRTVDGYRVTSWGGRWTNVKDPMHFEPTKCTRAQLERGIDWSTVNGNPQPGGESDMRQGDSGRAVAEIQHAGALFWGWDNGAWDPFPGRSLFDGKAFGPGEDGDFGPATDGNVRAWQKMLGFAESGILDGVQAGMFLAPYGTSVVPDLSKYVTSQELAAHAANPDAHHA